MKYGTLHDLRFDVLRANRQICVDDSRSTNGLGDQQIPKESQLLRRPMAVSAHDVATSCN